MKRTLISTLIACALAAPVVAWSQDRGVTNDQIVVGESLPFTGPVAFLGVAISLGAKLAIAEANAAGGINGRQIKLVSEDDAYVPARTVQAVRKLIEVDKVFAILGTSGSAHTSAAIPIVEEEKIPTLNTGSPAHTHYTPVKRYVFVLGMPYNDASYDFVKKLQARKPGGRWAAIFQDDDFGKDLEEGFQKAIKELGSPAPLVMKYKRGQTDFSAEVLRIKEAGNITHVLSGGIISENVAVVKELKLKGLNPLVGVMWTSHLKTALTLMGEAGEGMYLYDYASSLDDPKMAPFVALAKKLLKADEIDKMNRFTVVNYAGTKAMLEAMRRCGKNLTRECTVGEMEKLKDFDTGFGIKATWTAGNHLARQSGSVLVNDAKQLKLMPAQ